MRGAHMTVRISPFELAFSILKWGRPPTSEPLNPFPASAAPGPELPGAVNLPTEVDFTTHAEERLAQEDRVHSDEEEKEIRQRIQQMADHHNLFDQQKLLRDMKRIGIITHEIPKGDPRHRPDGNRILSILTPEQKKQIGHPLDGKLIPTVKTTFPIYHNPERPKNIWNVAQNKGLTHIIDMTGTHPLQKNKLHKVSSRPVKKGQTLLPQYWPEWGNPVMAIRGTSPQRVRQALVEGLKPSPHYRVENEPVVWSLGGAGKPTKQEASQYGEGLLGIRQGAFAGVPQSYTGAGVPVYAHPGTIKPQDLVLLSDKPMDLAFRLLKQRSPHPISPNRARIKELYPQGIHGPRSRPITDEERAAWEAEDAKECPDCSGLGFVEQMVPDPEEPGEMMWDTPPCITCNGTGSIA